MNTFSKTKTRIQKLKILVAGMLVIPCGQFFGTGAAITVTAATAIFSLAPKAEARTVRRVTRSTTTSTGRTAVRHTTAVTTPAGTVVRRTSRRVKTLPTGSRLVYVGGVSYYYASGVYWQRSGDVYVQVVFE